MLPPLSMKHPCQLEFIPSHAGGGWPCHNQSSGSVTICSHVNALSTAGAWAIDLLSSSSHKYQQFIQKRSIQKPFLEQSPGNRESLKMPPSAYPNQTQKQPPTSHTDTGHKLKHAHVENEKLQASRGCRDSLSWSLQWALIKTAE